MTQLYFTNSNIELIFLKVREFVDKELIPYVHEWDEAGDYPKELHEKAYNAGILAAMFPKGISL